MPSTPASKKRASCSTTRAPDAALTGEHHRLALTGQQRLAHILLAYGCPLIGAPGFMTLSDTIDEALAWRLRLTSDALAAATTIDALSTGLTVIGAAGISVALWQPVAAIALALLAAVVLLGLVAKWMAVRVRFDASVYAELVGAVPKSGFRTEHLDRALRGVGMLPANKEGRDWDTRCRSALRLMRRLGVLTALQGLLFVVAAGSVVLR
ncbi:MAG: hypothetical protein IT521_13580 [Burkholderiales bacterium]|nr:hypothetical protein [Burkholderiales bacterium]